MSYQRSVNTVKEFLASEYYTGDFNFDQLLGIIVATLSCSEYISDAEVAQLILGDSEQEFDLWFEDKNIRSAWVTIYNEYTEQLVAETFDLQELYPLAKDAIQPTQALSDWCDGYLHGYLLTEVIWLDDFDLLSGDPEFEQSQTIIDDCEACLNLMATFANWDGVLKESELSEQLQGSISEIYQALIKGCKIRHKLGLMLEDEKLDFEDDDYDDVELTEAEEFEFLEQVETFVRETPKIGRNDPCFCGSGKKFKKCCLN